MFGPAQQGTTWVEQAGAKPLPPFSFFRLQPGKGRTEVSRQMRLYCKDHPEFVEMQSDARNGKKALTRHYELKPLEATTLCGSTQPDGFRFQPNAETRCNRLCYLIA
jgi:hypothetical protein